MRYEIDIFDATDLEIARREHAAEMGGESDRDRDWYGWYDRATKALQQLGWDERFTSGRKAGQSRGLDGADAETGYSVDSAYDAWEAGLSVAAYMGKVKLARMELGL